MTRSPRYGTDLTDAAWALVAPLLPAIRTVMADAGHESRKLARELRRRDGWRLVIVKRGERAFRIVGLTWRPGARPMARLIEALAARLTGRGGAADGQGRRSSLRGPPGPAGQTNIRTGPPGGGRSAEHGPDAALPTLRHELAGDCPRRAASEFERCSVYFPQLVGLFRDGKRGGGRNSGRSPAS